MASSTLVSATPRASATTAMRWANVVLKTVSSISRCGGVIFGYRNRCVAVLYSAICENCARMPNRSSATRRNVVSLRSPCHESSALSAATTVSAALAR